MSLQVACETLRDVILERKGPKDVVLAVHRLNQTLLKARTFAEAEDLVTGTLLSGWKGGKAEGRGQGPAFLQVLVDIVVTGKPEAYPVLCLLHTFSLFKDSSDCLCRLQVSQYSWHSGDVHKRAFLRPSARRRRSSGTR